MSLHCNRPIRVAAVLLLATLAAGSGSAQIGRPGFPPGGLQVQTPPIAEYENARVGDKIAITVNGNKVQATVIAVTPSSVSIEYRSPGIRVGRTLAKSLPTSNLPTNVFGRNEGKKWNVGDEVLVRRGRDHVPATVVGASGTIVTVRMVGIDGTEREMKYPSSFLLSPDEVTPATKTSPFRPGPTGPLVDVLPNNGSRLWMDSTGKHTIEAVLASKSESSVALHRRDGSKTSLPINRLSIGDQRFLQQPEEQEAAPSRSSIPSTIRPFLSVPMERLSSTSSAHRQSVTGSSSESSAWKSVGFPSGDHADVLPLDRDGRLVLVTGRVSGANTDEGSPCQSIVCNVQTNDAIARILWPGEVKVLDYDAAYDHLLVGAGIENRTKYNFLVALSGLRSYQLNGIGYLDATFFQRPQKPSFGFAPSNKLFAGGAISGDRIIAQKADVLSAVTTGKSNVLFGFRSPDYLQPVLSPDKRFLALSDTAQIAIVEIRTGKIIRTMELNDGQNRTIAFSPDGRKLAAKSNRRLEIWDLSAAERLSDASFMSLTSASYGGLQWIDDQNVLLDEKYLYNLGSQNFVWTYSSLEAIRTLRGMTKLAYWASGAYQLASYKIPHAAATEWITDVGTNPESVLLDGSTPTQVLVDSSPVIYDEIEAIAETVGKKSGWNIQPTAEVSLIARVRQSDEPIEINVRQISRPSIGSPGFIPPRFGPSGFTPPTIRLPIPGALGSNTPSAPEKPLKKLSVRPYMCEYEIRYEGETLWNWSYGLKPGATVTANDTESDRKIAERVIQPNLTAMKSVLIPNKIVDEEKSLELRTSKIEPDGIVDVEDP